MYSITVLWPLAVFLVWFGCTGLALSTYLISLIAPEFLEEHPAGRLLTAGTHVFVAASLTFLLFLGTCTLYALLVVEWINRELLVTGHAVRVTVHHVPALPIPSALEPVRLGKVQANDYDEDHSSEEVSVDTSAPDGAGRAVTVGELTTILEEHPDWIDYLDRMLAWEGENPPANEYAGWEWQDVRCPPGVLNQMLVRGLINRVYSSRKYTNYRVVSPDEIREAREMLRDVSRPSGQGTPAKPDTNALFANVLGHDGVKYVLRMALDAPKPAHVLLWGPPGTAKSFLLDEIGHLPGAALYTSVMATKSGLTNLLVDTKPRYLVLHELDKMPAADMTPLLNLMQEGFVDVLHAKRRIRMPLECYVFASANVIDRIPEPIQSRFFKKELPAYTRAEFLAIAQTLLIRHLGLGAEVARLIAYEVARYSLDVREAEHIGNMCGGNPHNALRLIQERYPEGGRLTPLPRKE